MAIPLIHDGLEKVKNLTGGDVEPESELHIGWHLIR